MTSKRLIVKFRPYNANTLSSLINKSVKFSTVYEFNDPNELNYFSSESKWDGKHEKSFDEMIQVKLNDFHFRETVINNLYGQNYKKEYIDKIIYYLKKYPFKCLQDDIRDILITQIAYYSVGIFSASSIDIFEKNTDAAQLMFAHYADSWNGMALIYEPVDINELHKVYYPCDIDDEQYENRDGHCNQWRNENRKWSRGGEVLSVTRWANFRYNTSRNEMDDFCRKSKSWEYEHEYRMFGKPGMHKTSDILKLRAVLYTQRFAKENIGILESIIERFYKKEGVITFKIIPSESRYCFNDIDSNGGQSVLDRLNNLIQNS